MFPLYDENPRSGFPTATVLLIALNVMSWVFIQGWGNHDSLLASLCDYGLIPAELLGRANSDLIPLGHESYCELQHRGSWMTPLSSMFMHGGWMHILGNLWFLWVFGDNVEDVMGPLRFILFYMISGLAAAAAQVMTNTESTIPMVGASGAIGGVMGAYILLHPRARVHTLIFLGIFITTIAVPAFVMLGYWFLIQVLSGLPAIGKSQGGVAFWAHIGGFVAGVLLAKLFTQRHLLQRHRTRHRALRSRFRW